MLYRIQTEQVNCLLYGVLLILASYVYYIHVRSANMIIVATRWQKTHPFSANLNAIKFVSSLDYIMEILKCTKVSQNMFSEYVEWVSLKK